MNIPGITFDGTAPTMEGVWFNPKTGDRIKVRDTFFADNNYMVRTTDGRMLSYNQMQNYVRDDSGKADKEFLKSKQKSPELPTEQPQKPVIQHNDSDFLTEEDLKLLDGAKQEPMFTQQKDRESLVADQSALADLSAVHGLQNGMAERMNEMAQYLDKKGTEMNIADQMIERAMKDKTRPKITVSVEWPKAPEKELDILRTMMGVEDSDIARWMMKEFAGRDIIGEIKESVLKWLNPKQNTEQQEQEKPAEKKAAPKKKMPLKKK